MSSADFLRNTKLAITLIRSTIGTPKAQRQVVKALGLRKPTHTQIHKDGPATWGMVEKVIHLVRVRRIHAEHAKSIPKKPLAHRKSLGLTEWPDLPYN